MAETENRSWGQAKRFEFLEWRLFWIGKLNRRDLEEQFGISTPQASIDLRNYQEAAPGNLVYDSALKAFVRATPFRPKFLRVSGDRYLLQLRALHMGAVDRSDTWFADEPAVDVVPQLTRPVKDEDIRTVAAAVSNKTALIVTYKSLTSTRQRTIGPHALAYDGHRWHMRAWCYEKHEFKDFSLTRIVSAEPSQRSDFDPSNDLEWHRTTKLKLRAHPDLTDEQRETIELDFGMSDGCVELEMRTALAYYFIRRNYLDIPNLPALRQQVILSNFEQVEADIEEARAQTKRLTLNEEAQN